MNKPTIALFSQARQEYAFPDIPTQTSFFKAAFTESIHPSPVREKIGAAFRDLHLLADWARANFKAGREVSVATFAELRKRDVSRQLRHYGRQVLAVRMQNQSLPPGTLTAPPYYTGFDSDLGVRRVTSSLNACMRMILGGVTANLDKPWVPSQEAAYFGMERMDRGPAQAREVANLFHTEAFAHTFPELQRARKISSLILYGANLQDIANTAAVAAKHGAETYCMVTTSMAITDDPRTQSMMLLGTTSQDVICHDPMALSFESSFARSIPRDEFGDLWAGGMNQATIIFNAPRPH